jgi:hypothetical protein
MSLNAKIAWDWTASDPSMVFDHFEVWDANLSQQVTGTAPRTDGADVKTTPTDTAPLVLSYPGPGSFGVAVYAVDNIGQKSTPVFLTFTLTQPSPNPVTNLRFLGQ